MARAKKTKKTVEPAAAIAPIGAPTKFKPEYIELIREFFAVEPYYQSVSERSVEYFPNGKVKRAGEKFRLIPNKMPTLFGFARQIGVAYSTVWRWAEQGQDAELEARLQQHIEGQIILPPHEYEKIAALKEFCNAYNDAKMMQKEFLINLGLSGTTPPAAFIFVAKNVTDMRDEKKHLLANAEGGLLAKRVNELSEDELIIIAGGGQVGTST